MQTDDQTERQMDKTELIGHIYGYAKAPKSPRIKSPKEMQRYLMLQQSCL
jgi:hypothetical protein